MKIEIEVENFEDVMCGLNNALILFGNDIYAKFLGCKSDYKLSSISYEDSNKRYLALRKLYEDLCNKYE